MHQATKQPANLRLLRLRRRQLLLRAALVLLLLCHRGAQLGGLLAAPLVPLLLAAELQGATGADSGQQRGLSDEGCANRPLNRHATASGAPSAWHVQDPRPRTCWPRPDLSYRACRRRCLVASWPSSSPAGERGGEERGKLRSAGGRRTRTPAGAHQLQPRMRPAAQPASTHTTPIMPAGSHQPCWHACTLQTHPGAPWPPPAGG